MATIYEYLIKLNSNMSGVVAANKGLRQTDILAHKAQGTVTGLGSTLGSLKGVLGTIGVGFGMFQVVNLMEKGIEKAHDLHLAQAQINAGLISTGNAAGMTMQSIDAIASKISSNSLSSRADILSMQSVLLTFPNVSKASFGTASQAIADMSTRMKTDMSSTALQVGKALQDPILGITALRRAGVNFNTEQKEHIKTLVKTGQMAAAQTMILTELNKEFGGSAKAAYDATPLAHYNKSIGKIQLMIGELGVKVQESLAPSLEGLAANFKTALGIGVDFAKALWSIKDPILILAGAFAAYQTILTAVSIRTAILAWYNGLSTAAIIVNTLVTEGWAAAMVAVNIAMSANPIGFIIAGIAILVAGVTLAWQKFGWFKGAIYGTWEALKGFGIMLKDYVIDRIKGVLTGLGGLAKAIGQVFSGDFKAAWATAKQAGADLIGVDAAKNAVSSAKKVGKNISAAYHQGVAEVDTKNKGIEPAKVPGLGAATGGGNAGGGKAVKEGTNKVASGGSRSTSITINLGKMVESIVFQGGVKENAQDLTRQVEEILLRTLYAAQSAG